MRKSSALVVHEFGNPPEACRLEETELRAPERDEVLVEMRAAPVNPADLNLVEGKYGQLPELPVTPGVEGAGVVAEAGAESGIAVGTPVLLQHGVGAWCEAVTVKAGKVIAVPQGLDFQQLAMVKINPATAWRMLHDMVSLERGEWVIQNAANSAVGHAVIQIAKARGFRTVNIVRRPDVAAELRALGADDVVIEGEELPKVRPRLALNAVGGESALRLANALVPGGTLVTYGAMARQPLKIPNGLLIFKDLRFRGFWVTKWYQNAPQAEVTAMLSNLFEMLRAGTLHTPVEHAFPLSEYREALTRAAQGGREGKVLFEMNTGA